MEEESKAIPVIAEHEDDDETSVVMVEGVVKGKAETEPAKSPKTVCVTEIPKVVVHVLRANGIVGYTKRKGKEFSDAFATLTLTSKPTHSFNTKTIKRTTVNTHTQKETTHNISYLIPLFSFFF